MSGGAEVDRSRIWLSSSLFSSTFRLMFWMRAKGSSSESSSIKMSPISFLSIMYNGL